MSPERIAKDVPVRAHRDASERWADFMSPERIAKDVSIRAHGDASEPGIDINVAELGAHREGRLIRPIFTKSILQKDSVGD